jgi:hypothetical protein
MYVSQMRTVPSLLAEARRRHFPAKSAHSAQRTAHIAQHAYGILLCTFSKMQWFPCQCIDMLRVSLQRVAKLRATVGIPHTHSVIHRATSDTETIRAITQSKNPSTVPCARVQGSRCAQIPNSHCVIPRTCRKRVPARTECHEQHCFAVACARFASARTHSAICDM